MSLTHISLFTGIGGIDLAAEAAGFQTIAQVERDTYCRRVLARHWPGVPRFDDVRDVTADTLRDAGIGRPTLVSGGFPCQPFSFAGKRRGADDDRFLWPEMCRIVSELRPAWVLGENVAGFVSMALDDCASDLERLGYAVRAFVVPAAGVGAPHQRARCFVVAHAEHDGRDGPEVTGGARARTGAPPRQERAEQPAGSGRLPRGVAYVADPDEQWKPQSEGALEDIGRWSRNGGPALAHSPSGDAGPYGDADPGRDGAYGHNQRRRLRDEPRGSGAAVADAEHAGGALHRPPGRVGRLSQPVPGNGRGERATEPGLGGIVDGLSARLDRGCWGPDWETGVPRTVAAGQFERCARLRALGNAVVPAQVYPFVKAIADIERGVIA